VHATALIDAIEEEYNARKWYDEKVEGTHTWTESALVDPRMNFSPLILQLLNP